MAEHRDDDPTHDDARGRAADPLTRRERREDLPRQSRRTHDDVGRAETADPSRWRFSDAVEAARHLRRSR